MSEIIVCDTASASGNYVINDKCYYTGVTTVAIPTFYKLTEYKCVYCGSVIKNREGTCPNCGAPLSEAVEI
jgi:uncharacterized OB-fold protein